MVNKGFMQYIFSYPVKGSSLLAYLKLLLSQFGYENQITDNKNYLIAEGDIPIALVAHLDTVHAIEPFQFFYDEKEMVMWSPQGLGADDRAGVILILSILSEGYRPHLIFTTGEEHGGIGANKLVKDYNEVPFNIDFMIELDRCGSEDAVFYNCMNLSFIDYICSFGFTFEEGSFTDICILGQNWNIAAVNLSIGYYNEHTKAEYWDLFEADDTITKVINILRSKNSNTYIYVPATKDNRIIRCSCGRLCYPGEYDQITSIYGPTKIPFTYNVCHFCKKLHEEDID
jgi:hypothetical protein